MKLKIKDKEYGLNWGLGAFSIVMEEMDLSIEEIIARFSEHKVNTALTYSALLNAYRVQLDDDYATLEFGKTYFASWLEEQSQEIGDEILKSFLNWTTHSKSWADKLGIDIEKLFPAEKDEKKKATTNKRGQKSKVIALDGN